MESDVDTGLQFSDPTNEFSVKFADENPELFNVTNEKVAEDMVKEHRDAPVLGDDVYNKINSVITMSSNDQDLSKSTHTSFDEGLPPLDKVNNSRKAIDELEFDVDLKKEVVKDVNESEDTTKGEDRLEQIQEAAVKDVKVSDNELRDYLSAIQQEIVKESEYCELADEYLVLEESIESEKAFDEKDTEKEDFSILSASTKEIVNFGDPFMDDFEDSKPSVPLYNNFMTGVASDETVAKGMETSESFDHLWVSYNQKTYLSGVASNIRNCTSSRQSEIPAPIHCLPDEVLLKIFSYFSNQDLCVYVTPVCSKWRELARDNSLWHELDFSNMPHLSTLNFLWVLRRAPLLRKIIVRGRQSILTPEIAIFTECCPHLQEIDFGFCDNINRHGIQCVADNCPDLVKLNVEGCDNIDHTCLRYIIKCKHLTHMNFSHCVAIQDAGISFIAKNMDKIVSINLDGMNFITDRYKFNI